MDGSESATTSDGASLGVAMAAHRDLPCCGANPYEDIACTRQDGDAFHAWAAPVRPDLVGTSLFARQLRRHAGLYLQTFARCMESETASSRLLRIGERYKNVSKSAASQATSISSLH